MADSLVKYDPNVDKGISPGTDDHNYPTAIKLSRATVG